MKHTKVVSKCCEAEIDHNGGYGKNDEWFSWRCCKCDRPCDTVTITLAPDSEIAEVLKKHLDNYTYQNKKIYSIAEQLNIPLDEK